MTDPSRTRGTPCTETPSATPAPTWRSGWLPGGLLGLALALVVLPWYDTRVHGPGTFMDLPRGGAILVVQPGDCPDRTRTLRRWLAALPESMAGGGTDTGPSGAHGNQASGGPLPMGVAVLGAGDAPLPVRLSRALAGLPRLDPSEAGRAARQLRGMAVEGSPALLVVDAGGRPVLASDFTPDGAVPGLAAVLELTAVEVPPVLPGTTAPSPGHP